MISQKFVYPLKKAINLFMVIALMMAGVAVNVSPAQAAAGDIVIIAPAADAKIPVKDGDLLTVQFTVDSTGKSGLGSYEISIGDKVAGTYSVLFDGSEAQLFTRQITIPTMTPTNEGLQSLKVEVDLADEGGPYIETQSNAVIVDNLDPVAPVLTAPNGGEAIPFGALKEKFIMWQAYTLNADETFTLYFSADNGAHWSTIADFNQSELETYGDPELDWTPSVVTTQGLIKIEVVDDAGNKVSDQSAEVFTIYGVDNSAPTPVEMTPPASVIKGEYTLMATASDPQSGIAGVLFQYSLDEGASWSEAGAGSLVGTSWQLAFDTTSLPDGDVQFRAIATNGVGLSKTSAAVAAVIDNSDPVILSFNLANGDWVGKDFEFTVTASDAHSKITGMDVYQFLDGDDDWSETLVCSVTEPGEADDFDVYTLKCTDDTEALSEDAIAIKVEVTNGAELTAEVSRTVQVDLELPFVTNALTAPANDAVLHLGDPLEIKWTTTGTGAVADENLAGIDLQLRDTSDNVLVEIAENTENDGSFTWTVAGVPWANNYKVCLVARDLAGNTAEDCNTGITIWGSDLTPPVVTLAPVASPNKGTIALSATASDPESGIQKVEFYRIVEGTPTLIFSDPNAPYAASWDSGTVNGEVLFKAVATNGAGVTAEHEIGPVLIDNTFPVVGSVSPAGGTELTPTILAGSVIFSAQVTEEGSGIASVTFEYYEDDDWVAIGAGTYNAGTGKYDAPAWDTNAFEDGTIVRIQVIAIDEAGNEQTFAETNNYYKIDNAQPEETIDLYLGWNLISLPLVPSDSDIETLLSDLIDRSSVKQVVAWPFEGDTIHEKRWNGENYLDVTEIVDGVGYWVEMSKPDVLTFTGDYLPEPPLAPPSYIVHRGWNLIGFLSTNPVAAAEYLGEAGEGNMRAMYGFNESTGYYVPITLETDLEPRNGYWLAVSVDATIYPYVGIDS